MAEQKRYSQYEEVWKQSEKRVNAEIQLARGFQLADIYLNRTYLDTFSSANIVPTSRAMKDATKMRILEITKLVYDKKEKFTDRLKSVYSTLHSFNSSVALLISSDSNLVRFYIGIKSIQNASIAGDVLESTLKGNFPGITYRNLSVQETEQMIEKIENSQIKSLASVSVVPSMREGNSDIESFVQGIEKFIDTMCGKKYVAVFLATPLNQEVTDQRKHGYEELYSSLSPHAKLSYTYGENESAAVNESISTSFSKSVNRSVTNSNTVSSSESNGTNYGTSDGYGSNYSQSNSSDSSGWNVGVGSNHGWSEGSFNSYTSGNSFTQSFSDSSGISTTDGRTRGTTDTKGSSKTISITYENKGVEILMKRAQDELERFKLCESFGMWEFSSYFLSKDIHTTALAGNVYRALMTGDNSNVEKTHMNIWSLNQKESIFHIMEYILHFSHPQAELPDFEGGYAKQLVTPTNLISGNELPIVMGFPKKSVPGLPVVEMAEFGRTVVYENEKPRRSIEFGNIYHMGVVEETRVEMNLDLLSSHCFITGSSGSGKSFATYQLLDQVIKNDIKVMIIEPTKGEYKQVFGGLKGIKIFTTDPNAYRLLKINPFQFPDKIHILSHIEQLLQIFNASWPLYAAMPAILKKAINDAYVQCGWDIQNSMWIPGISDHKYPVFRDVLEILPGIINHSDYSSDSKGDYKGALLTRVESMTVGINGLIFKNSEGVDDSILFDSNSVIDLSELGSDESIALIMGVLIMKLNEYRKSQRKSNQNLEFDSLLKHITVLEEAHNLLKRTSKEQNQDEANIVGKSVEMISNSIKEMRTYGEGFIIIDQSPMAVDGSVIENTATKIIMNTPARDACEELGSALSLNEEQMSELSRLNVGVAAVLQKGWLAPVLMKVDKWDNRYSVESKITNNSELRIFKGELVNLLIEQYQAKRFSPMKIRGIIKNSRLTIDKKREMDEIFLSYNDCLFERQNKNRKLFGKLLMEIIGCNELFEIIPLNGIPSYSDFLKYDVESPEFSNLVQKFERGTEQWFESFFKSLDFYLILDSEKLKAEVILFLLDAVDKNEKLNSDKCSKLMMLWRMVCHIFEIKLQEK